MSLFFAAEIKKMYLCKLKTENTDAKRDVPYAREEKKQIV